MGYYDSIGVAKAVIRKYNWLRQFDEISEEDIIEICANALEWAQRCDEIASECEEEGYPSGGSNYDLRVDMEKPKYKEVEDEILSKYPRFAEDDDEDE